jgi:hypothetical protein
MQFQQLGYELGAALGGDGARSGRHRQEMKRVDIVVGG